MKGYFTHLAKLSSVAIGARTPSARPGQGALPRVPPEVIDAPLHIESVALVDSSPAGETALQHSVERSVHRQDAHGGPRISSADQPAAREVVESNAHKPSIAGHSDDSDKQTAELSELSFVQQTSTSSLASEKASESEPDIAGPKDMGLERRSAVKPGVVRVGELVRSSEPELASDADSSATPARAIHRPEPSIPRDYLEAIHEWLGSPPARSDVTDNRGLVEQNYERVTTTSDQANGSLHSEVSYRDFAPQSGVQEFSLSVGSISIIVEEARQQPTQQPRIVQAPVKASTGAGPRARDAFALSRSYFRGF